jgi:H+/Cl- antiporter ClcA
VDHVSNERRPAPPPLEANDQLVTAVITAGWAVALIVVLAVRPDIPASDRWWIWTCVTGLGLGVFGLLYVPWLKRSRDRAARRRAARGDR